MTPKRVYILAWLSLLSPLVPMRLLIRPWVRVCASDGNEVRTKHLIRSKCLCARSHVPMHTLFVPHRSAHLKIGRHDYAAPVVLFSHTQIFTMNILIFHNFLDRRVVAPEIPQCTVLRP